MRHWLGLGSAAYLNTDFNPSANTIVVRDVNGFVKSHYFNNSNTAVESSTPAALNGENGDGWIRKYSATAIQSFLGLGSAAFTSNNNYFQQSRPEGNLSSFNTINGQWNTTSATNQPSGDNPYWSGINFGFDTNNYAILTTNATPDQEFYLGKWSFGWRGYNKIWHSGNFNPSVYLPLTGGKVTGSVGIAANTLDPDAKLTVGGKIHSQEVKVTVSAGADFVFENDYNLKPLAEVAEFISENKHLPEIASAREMEKNGLELGEMNIKLLQKIEELTLHLIEQNKLVLEQNKVNLAQNKHIEELEKLIKK